MISMIPWTRSEANLFRYLDEQERSFWKSTVNGSAQFRCDISEKDNHYLLEADLPGFDKDNINIDVDGETLTISARQESKKEDAGNGYIRRERRYGSYNRSFDISGIDAANIQAQYKDGVLSLNLPKQQETPPASRRIEISAQSS